MKDFAQWDSTHSYIASYDQRFTRPPNLVSNGPYRLADWSFKRRVRLIASDYYWNPKSVKSRVVDQIYANDPLAAYRIYESVRGRLADGCGKRAWCQSFWPSTAKDLKVFPAFGSYFYDFNCYCDIARRA